MKWMRCHKELYFIYLHNETGVLKLRFLSCNPTSRPSVTWPLCHCSTRPLVASHSIRWCCINAVIHIGIAGVKWYTVGLIARGGDEKHHLLKLVWKYGGQKGGRSDMPAECDWYWETFSNETFNQLFPTWPSTRRMPLRDCLFCLKTLTLRSGIITLILLFCGGIQVCREWSGG